MSNKIRKVQGNDSFQRMSYLYQISKTIAECNPALSSYYGNLIINIAKKNVLKLHPDLKRQMCRRCRCMLIDKVTGSIKLKTNKKSRMLVYTCFSCNNKRKITIDKNKEHTLWVEKNEAILEVME